MSPWIYNLTQRGETLKRIVEAYVGEYASGKSECAVNRALELLPLPSVQHPITLVDLDTVEPTYTLRPIREELIGLGLDVVAWSTAETTGLGEAGSVIRPEMRWVLKRPGSLILDIGYGVQGAKTLNIIEGAWDDQDLKILAVLNLGRPLTGSYEDMLDYVRELGPIHGLINNSHLGEETTVSFIQEGARVVSEVGEVLHIPVVATTADEKLRDKLGSSDGLGHPVRYLTRFMPHAFW
ncbi:hypothetical protein DSOL_0234 [Desulfosporosinus metallidurans]|uniref:Uncharacterized protein n=1 Tax=Desulfosporosinus metallidurans TaxID=1888891 RepID=A0A1Q8R347_9FIRM|nr:hypothetical protein [Desulfosporosinus metallidurans]OLN34056.1 hypothetical protein DSOL_0234 [Desulfosporosinus metallidurans]